MGSSALSSARDFAATALWLLLGRLRIGAGRRECGPAALLVAARRPSRATALLAGFEEALVLVVPRKVAMLLDRYFPPGAANPIALLSR